MERGKASSGRGSKTKTPLYPADLYALGSKASNEGKPRPSTSSLGAKVPPLPNVGEREKKREGGSIPPVVPNKKAKMSSSSFLGRGNVAGSSSTGSPSSSSSSDSWESVALEVDPSELVTQVLEAADVDDIDKVVGYICGAIKLLKAQRFKPDVVVFQSIVYLAKVKPQFFSNDCVVSALCSLLKRENAFAFKAKGNISTLYLTVNLLMATFVDIKRWPDILLKTYLEDSQGERIWVDQEFSKQFVDNITTSLSTKKIPLSVRDVVPHEEEPAPLKPSTNPPPPPPIPRFRWNKDLIENIVVENIKDQLTRKQGTDMVTRNFIRTLTSLCGISEVRLMAAGKVEVWLQNPKLMRSAQELLMTICVNCLSHSFKDIEIISLLIKMRLKTKALGNYYLACIKELVNANEDNLSTVLKHTIYNELSTPRNPNNNMALLSVIFQMDPDRSTTFLADIFLELVYNREDYLRSVRTLLREMARVLRGELKLVVFCQGLFSREEQLPRDAEPARAFAAVADLVTLAVFLAVMPLARSDKKDLQQIERIYSVITQIQSEAVSWMFNSVLSLYRPTTQDFVHILHKILFLEPAEQYTKVDNWPEQDRGVFIRLSTEAPVHEATLITLLALGISKEYPVSAQETLEFAEQLVKRAAGVTNPISPLLSIEKMKVVDLVLNACAYRHPENIDLPPGYSPPALAIASHYWKAWTILLVLSAHNPTRLGALAWEKYPTLRTLMEMCITGHFAFPPGYDDLQMLAIEKQRILEFECHLAAASTKMEVTEATSLLLPQLISMEPLGPGRRPPPATLEHIKLLNTSLRLGHLLCRSRDPDFLLDIIQRQGPSQSMPWLADLVHSSDGSLNHLPVQCLCEFLMSCSPKQETKYQELLAHLQSIVNSPQEEPSAACEVLDYFLRRLGSPTNRSLAISGLKLILSAIADDNVIDLDRSLEDKGDTYWLTCQLPVIPHFKIARPQIIVSLRAACQVENDPALIIAYLSFLAEHAVDELSNLSDLVLDMATLIVERSTIMSAILPAAHGEPNPALDAFVSIFYCYLIKAREPRKGEYTWSESQDQVLVSWYTGEECTIHILVVHAMVILLTYGPDSITRIHEYNALLEIWFPRDLEHAPKGFLVDTSEEALLIPDWLKLRMIRSHVPRLVEAALTDLDISQLILFIQSFGIPIASMSKLLSTLDNAVLSQREAVAEAVLDKQYMAQLVEVQHRRGAVGGLTFTKVLELDADKAAPLPPEPTLPHTLGRPKKEPRVKRQLLTSDECIETLEKLYQFPETSVDSYHRDQELFRAFQQTLVHEIRSGNNELVKCIIFFLVTKVATDKAFSCVLFLKPQFSCPLFRLIIAHNPDPPALTVIAKKILHCSLDMRNPRSKPMVNILVKYVQTQNDLLTIKTEEKVEGNSVDCLNEAMANLLVTPSPLSGHLVDKIVKLEPEILGSSLTQQMRLLFSADHRDTLHCRPYLLTLLTHHASWKTLHQCTDMLLQKDPVEKYDPTAVLDFLQALVCNPKLWQGREKHTPKHYTPEDVLGLNLEQLQSVTNYIVTEGVMTEGADPGGRFGARLGLLSQTIVSTNMGLSVKLASHLASRTLSSSGREKEMCNQLLAHLYLKFPSLICKLKSHQVKLISDQSLVSVKGSSPLDVLSHRLLTAISSIPNYKDWSKKSQDLELAVRKMASTHPLLTLRQLSLVASSLFGRVELDWSVFKSRGHLLYFQQVSSLLLLLQPHVFNRPHMESLHKILDVFLELFQNYSGEHGAQLPITNLLCNFTQLMQNYIKLNHSSAQEYLQYKADVIRELQMDYPVLTGFCVIVQRLDGPLEVYLTPSSPNEQPPPQWENKLAQITSNQDLAGGLSYVEYTTSKRPSMLAPLLEMLLELMGSPSSQVRNHAHTLVARYIRHDPSVAPQVFPTFISLLESHHPDVVSSALQRLPEFVLLSQDVALKLLQKLVTLGTCYNINTGECISKIINLLNLQNAC